LPDLRFQVESAEVIPIPAMSLGLAIVNACTGEQVQSIALTAQVQIEPARRRYSEAEARALADLFGERDRWGTTVRPLFWTTINAVVPGFTGSTRFDLHVPFTLDPNIAAAKYLRALEAGEVPLTLLFSGRVIYNVGELIQMAPIPWSLETSCRIPVLPCRQVLDAPSWGSGSRGATWM
jgi:hypothetical protein